MTLSKIKYNINSLIGKKVVVIFFGSRNKIDRYVGTVYKTYKNIFTIKLASGNIKSFSYIDVLTKTVKICN